MKLDVTKEFLGDGLLLWPAQKVTGALNVALFAFELDNDIRNGLQFLSDLFNIIHDSKFVQLLANELQNTHNIGREPILAAANDLAGVFSKIGKLNSDDNIAVILGTYGLENKKSGTQREEIVDANMNATYKLQLGFPSLLTIN